MEKDHLPNTPTVVNNRIKFPSLFVCFFFCFQDRQMAFAVTLCSRFFFSKEKHAQVARIQFHFLSVTFHMKIKWAQCSAVSSRFVSERKREKQSQFGLFVWSAHLKNNPALQQIASTAGAHKTQLMFRKLHRPDENGKHYFKKICISRFHCCLLGYATLSTCVETHRI